MVNKDYDESGTLTGNVAHLKIFNQQKRTLKYLMTTFESEFAQGNLNKAEIRKLNQKYEFLNFSLDILNLF